MIYVPKVCLGSHGFGSLTFKHSNSSLIFYFTGNISCSSSWSNAPTLPQIYTPCLIRHLSTSNFLFFYFQLIFAAAAIFLNVGSNGARLCFFKSQRKLHQNLLPFFQYFIISWEGYCICVHQWQVFRWNLVPFVITVSRKTTSTHVQMWNNTRLHNLGLAT